MFVLEKTFDARAHNVSGFQGHIRNVTLLTQGLQPKYREPDFSVLLLY